MSQDGTDMKCPPHPPLANNTVNFVGDHVAVAIAETLDQAKDAKLFPEEYRKDSFLVSGCQAQVPGRPCVLDAQRSTCHLHACLLRVFPADRRSTLAGETALGLAAGVYYCGVGMV